MFWDSELNVALKSRKTVVQTPAWFEWVMLNVTKDIHAR